jgi:hypothetical protein
MSFPTVVYKCPGQNSANGFTYEWIGVSDSDALQESIDAGYSLTLAEANEKYQKEYVSEKKNDSSINDHSATKTTKVGRK